MRPALGLRYMVPNFNGEYVNMRPLIFPFPRDILEMVSFSILSFRELMHSDKNIFKTCNVYVACSKAL